MSRPINTQSSTVIDVCLIGIRGELLAFLHCHSGGQTRIVRGTQRARGVLCSVVTGGILGDEASFGTMCWHPYPVPKRAGHETSNLHLTVSNLTSRRSSENKCDITKFIPNTKI